MNSLTQAGLSLAAENQRMVGRLTCYELCGEVLWCNLRHRLRWRSMSRRLWSECSEDHSDILQVRDMLLKAFAHGSKRRRGPPAVPVVCVAAGRAGRGEQRAVCRPLLMPPLGLSDPPPLRAASMRRQSVPLLWPRSEAASPSTAKGSATTASRRKGIASPPASRAVCRSSLKS